MTKWLTLVSFYLDQNKVTEKNKVHVAVLTGRGGRVLGGG